MVVVLVTLAATLCLQLGYFLWKVSADHQPRIGHDPALKVMAALLGDPKWLAGLAFTVVGWLLFLRATGLGEISLVQPLMSTGDLVLVLLAVVFLGERLGRREWIGLAVTVLGAVGLAWQATTVPGTAAAGWRLAVFAAVTLGAAALGATRLRARDGGELPLALAVGLCFGTGAVLTEAWSSVAPDGWRAALHPLLLGVVVANVAGLVLLQSAFQRGRAAIVVPVQLAVANVVAMVGGAWLFAEHLPASRVVSAGLVVLGAWQLQSGGTPAPAPGAEDRHADES